MEIGICNLSVIPVRISADDRSEMVTQLLFGEIYHVQQENEKWCQIKSDFDSYSGWIDKKQHNVISNKEYEVIKNNPEFMALDVFSKTEINGHPQTILLGSSLPRFDGITYKIGKKKGVYNGQAIRISYEQNHNLIGKIVKKYLNTPYLWGGRSPFGIDCSGFTQMVFKFIGIHLKRDAYQQVDAGRLVNLITEAHEGDLAFFENTEGKITHVGIITEDQRIIHASGKVRIDRIDNYGIFNSDTEKYSHKLKVIKRLI